MPLKEGLIRLLGRQMLSLLNEVRRRIPALGHLRY